MNMIMRSVRLLKGLFTARSYKTNDIREHKQKFHMNGCFYMFDESFWLDSHYTYRTNNAD